MAQMAQSSGCSNTFGRVEYEPKGPDILIYVCVPWGTFCPLGPVLSRVSPGI